MDDELDARRDKNVVDEDAKIEEEKKEKAVDGIQDYMEAAMSQKDIKDFAEWCKENMPTEKFRDGANQISSGIFGILLGSWFDAGASPEQMKEYLSRFTDLLWDQWQVAVKRGG